MKVIIYTSLVWILSSTIVQAQNLYTTANAANIENEANTTTGWTGPAAIASVSLNPQNGSWNLRVTSNSGGNRHVQYTFTAVVGTTYNISIWARRGSNNSNSVFANWAGWQNFTTTSITSQTWAQYNFTLTATSTAPTIRIYASDGGPAGRTAYFDAITITAQAGDTQPPTAPTNLASSNVTATSLTLTWTASTDNIGVTNYRIYQNGTQVGQTGNATTTFNVTGLTASTSYSYYVRAEDAAGNLSTNSNTINVTTSAPPGDTQPPTAPTNLASSNVTSTTLTLTWTASTDNIGVTNYRIYQDGTQVGQTGNATTTFNVTGLTASTSYSYYVRAEDAAGNLSTNSNTINVTTSAPPGDTQPPTAPTNLASSNVTSTTLTLTWTASTDNIGVTNYRIYQDGTQVGQTGNATTTFNVTGLTASTPYSFYVRAEDAAGNLSANSNTINVTTSAPPGDTQPPTAPTNLASSNVTSTTLTLTWTASTDNVGVTNYRIYQDGTQVGQTGNSTTTFNVTGLTASTAYSFFVRAEDAAGNLSANSNTINVTTTAPPGDTQPPTAPTNLASSNVTSTTLTLTWTASTDNVGVTNYRIYQNGTQVGQTGNSTTTFNVTGLTASTAYSFFVRAEDAAGNLSANSNTINVTTTAPPGDTQPPTAPTNLASSNVTATSLTLTWTASTDNIGVTNYRIYRNGTQTGQTGNASASFNVSGLTASTAYSFFVRAEDAAGNLSANSNTINVTTSSAGGGGNAYTNENANLPTVNWQSQNLYVSGVMGISTQPNAAFLLSVNGDIRTKDLVVQPGWSDFVFEPEYKLPSLKEVEEFIIANGRLIDIPSAAEIEENGAKLGEINALLLLKIEELTLYLIEMNKKLNTLENDIEKSY